MKMTIRTTTVVLMPMRNFIDGSMNIFRKIKLSARYAKAVYLVSAAYSFTAAGLCVFDPTLTPTFVLLKLLFIPCHLVFVQVLPERADHLFLSESGDQQN